MTAKAINMQLHPRVVNRLASDLEEQWEIHKFTNDWGSGEDRIVITDAIAEDFFLDSLWDMGYDKVVAEAVMTALGFGFYEIEEWR